MLTCEAWSLPCVSHSPVGERIRWAVTVEWKGCDKGWWWIPWWHGERAPDQLGGNSAEMLAWETFRLSSEKQDGIVEGKKGGEDFIQKGRWIEWGQAKCLASVRPQNNFCWKQGRREGRIRLLSFIEILTFRSRQLEATLAGCFGLYPDDNGKPSKDFSREVMFWYVVERSL